MTDIVKIAKIFLSDVDKNKILSTLETINLTNQEKTIIIQTELNGLRLYEMCDVFSLSIDSISHIKRNAMQKIGIFLARNLQ